MKRTYYVIRYVAGHVRQTACLAALSAASVLVARESGSRLTLHYDRPAEHFEEALVIGNGTLGAVVYGGTHTDRISLNDITLWTGMPDTEVTTPGAHKALPEIRALLDKGDYRAADRANRKIQGHSFRLHLRKSDAGVQGEKPHHIV